MDTFEIFPQWFYRIVAAIVLAVIVVAIFGGTDKVVSLVIIVMILAAGALSMLVCVGLALVAVLGPRRAADLCDRVGVRVGERVAMAIFFATMAIGAVSALAYVAPWAS